MERLQKVIANAGITSRRRAEQMILDGLVTVNGHTVQELGIKVDPSLDDVRVNGKKIKMNNNEIVVLFNKPRKVITTMEDPQGRETVIDLIDICERVYPVGRLDYDSEGLLLLTNIGELANHLMHPKFEINKIYEVIISGIPSEAELNKLREGIELEEGRTSPASLKIISKNQKNQAKIEVIIHEGRKRQIRRMFKYINYRVINLKRVKYGFLTLAGVPVGSFRLLSKDEICQLKKAVKLTC